MNDFYFYTETAFHHEGDMDYARQLIVASKQAGAQGIKFQVMTRTEDFISTRHSAFDNLAKWTFCYDQWNELFAFTKEQSLDIIMMPLNVDAIGLVKEFPIKFLEIHSVSFNDHELHEAIKGTNIDLIIGVGGRTGEEMEAMQAYFGPQLKVLMTGFQSFPSKLEDIKLGRITDLKQRFPGLTIGYTDHSAFDHEHAIISNEYAYLLGARIFEKHITVSEGVERVDFASAVSPEKIEGCIRRLAFLRDYVLVPQSQHEVFNEAETKYRNRQLICVANRALPAGHTLEAGDIGLKLIDSTENTFTTKAALLGAVLNAPVEMDMAILSNQII